MRENAVKLLKHSQELCLNFEKFFEDLSTKFKQENCFKKSNQASINDMFEFSDGSYIKDYFYHSNGIIKGCRMLICAGNTDDYKIYNEICKKLGIDHLVPMILIYGVIKPVKKTTECIDNLNTILNVCSGFVEEYDQKVDWTNFNANDIAFDSEVHISNTPWSKEQEREYGMTWNGYFSDAKIKIKSIFDISNATAVENLVNEIEEMGL